MGCQASASELKLEKCLSFLGLMVGELYSAVAHLFEISVPDLADIQFLQVSKEKLRPKFLLGKPVFHAFRCAGDYFLMACSQAQDVVHCSDWKTGWCDSSYRRRCKCGLAFSALATKATRRYYCTTSTVMEL